MEGNLRRIGIGLGNFENLILLTLELFKMQQFNASF